MFEKKIKMKFFIIERFLVRLKYKKTLMFRVII